VNYQIVELTDYSGEEATIYSIIEEGEQDTIFEKFIVANLAQYKDELKNIAQRLNIIGNDVGAREQFFKTKEGKPGDLVCALYDEPDKHLRLYCIRFGSVAIIVGGGGPKSTRSWQQDENLSQEVNKMIKVSNDIHQRILSKEIAWSSDGKELLGNLEFTDDE
jgi:hypothetical protein